MVSKMLRRAMAGQPVSPKMFEKIHKNWTYKDELEPIMVGPDCILSVYSFTYNNNWDQHRLSSIPPLGSTLVIKMYDVDYRKRVPPGRSYFCAEVLALNAIKTHNAQSDEKIGVPEIYDYGIAVMSNDEDQVWTCCYILMSYIEDNEEEMGEEALEKAKSKINSDIKGLKSIGIAHGDLERKNMRYNETNPMLIDYSHALSQEIAQVRSSVERQMEALYS